MNTIRTWIIACGLMLTTAASAMPPHGGPGGPRGHRGPPPPHEMIRKHADELGIDAETVETVVAIAEEARERMEALRRTKHEAARTLRQLLSEDSPDRQAVMAQVDRLSEAEAEEKKHHLTVLMDIREQLTTEQRSAIETFQKRRRPGHPRPHGPPPHRE